MANNGLHFGFSGVRITELNNTPVGVAQILGSFSGNVSPELIMTMGGAFSLPIASRPGRAEGEATLTLRERPGWIDEFLFGSAKNTAAASSSTAVGTAVAIGGGNTVQGNITVAAPDLKDRWDLTAVATGASAADITLVGSGGALSFPAVALSTTPVELGNTGVVVSKTASNYTAGHGAVLSLTPPHNGVITYSTPAVISGKDYKLYVYTSLGGGEDSANVFAFNRVAFKAPPITLTDVEPTGEVEVGVKIMAPLDGGVPWTREVIVKPS